MKCCICNKEIKGYGHNADPVKDGRCCDDCNFEIVVPTRVNQMNILQQAAIAQANFTKGIYEMNGYETKTTFYGDFTIAEPFGRDAVLDTYNRVMESWKFNAEYMTELTLVLNHKIWEHHHKGNDTLMIVYDTLWKKQDEWCMSSLSDEDLEDYLKITD